jgi:hypothetical protein
MQKKANVSAIFEGLIINYCKTEADNILENNSSLQAINSSSPMGI